MQIIAAAFLFAGVGWVGPEAISHVPERAFGEVAAQINEVVTRPVDGGIREDIPDKLKVRFQKWKADLLSTDFGRKQWAQYETNARFLLVIRVDRARGRGAGTDKFLWDTDGNFVGATITLGSELDEGFPPPTYYPVLNALEPTAWEPAMSPQTLAAAKMSHELAHVEQTAIANMNQLQLQSRLMPQYVSIFLNNGLNRSDKRLLELEKQMGGTPTSIWEVREYTSELDTLRFVAQRFKPDNGLCTVLKKVHQNLESYAHDFEQRFTDLPEFSAAGCN